MGSWPRRGLRAAPRRAGRRDVPPRGARRRRQPRSLPMRPSTRAREVLMPRPAPRRARPPARAWRGLRPPRTARRSAAWSSLLPRPRSSGSTPAKRRCSSRASSCSLGAAAVLVACAPAFDRPGPAAGALSARPSAPGFAFAASCAFSCSLSGRSASNGPASLPFLPLVTRTSPGPPPERPRARSGRRPTPRRRTANPGRRAPESRGGLPDPRPSARAEGGAQGPRLCGVGAPRALRGAARPRPTR